MPGEVGADTRSLWGKEGTVIKTIGRTATPFCRGGNSGLER